MTNKKFSIRKLAVGTASVAIGFSASGTIDSILANDYTDGLALRAIKLTIIQITIQ